MQENRAADFFERIGQIEARRRARYGIEFLKQTLGNEPWDCGLVLELYMKNSMAMKKVLKNSKGAQVFRALLEFRNMMRTTSFFKEQALFGIESINQRVRSDENFRRKLDEDYPFLECQENINSHFFGYASASYALIALQTRLQKNHSVDKRAISELFETILEGDCHNCLHFLRNLMAHGNLLRFTSIISVKLNPYGITYSFVLNEDTVNSVERRETVKDRKGKQYLLDNSCDLNVVLTNHYEILHKFYEAVYASVFDEHQKEIFQSNEYFKNISRQAQAQLRAIAKSIGKKLPENQPQDIDSGTYYLARALGYRML